MNTKKLSSKIAVLALSTMLLPLLAMAQVTPSISSLSPSSMTVGGASFTMTVNGSNFLNGATVRVNGSNRTTTYVSSNQLTASIPSSDIASTGSLAITVVNPQGEVSNSATFTVFSNTPVITSISPSSTVVGSGAATLTVNGSGFLPNSTINFNGNSKTTTYVSASQLTALLPASDFAAVGSFLVTVTNPSIATSNSATFTVSQVAPSVPVVSSVSPNLAIMGSNGTTITVTGAGFMNGAIVSFNDLPLVTTFVSSTQLRASVPTDYLSEAAANPIRVTNPGGNRSNAVIFTTAGTPGLPNTGFGPSADSQNAHGLPMAAGLVVAILLLSTVILGARRMASVKE